MTKIIKTVNTEAEIHQFIHLFTLSKEGKTKEAEQFILDHPEVIYLQDAFGNNILHFVANHQNWSLWMFCVERMFVENDVAFLKTTLQRGNKDNSTAMHLLFCFGTLNILQEFAHFCAAIKIKIEPNLALEEFPYLFLASLADDVKKFGFAIKLMHTWEIDVAAMLTTLTQCDGTILHWACARGSAEMLECVLQQLQTHQVLSQCVSATPFVIKANINQMTPLQILCSRQNCSANLLNTYFKYHPDAIATAVAPQGLKVPPFTFLLIYCANAEAMTCFLNYADKQNIKQLLQAKVNYYDFKGKDCTYNNARELAFRNVNGLEVGKKLIEVLRTHPHSKDAFAEIFPPIRRSLFSPDNTIKELAITCHPSVLGLTAKTSPSKRQKTRKYIADENYVNPAINDATVSTQSPPQLNLWK